MAHLDHEPMLLLQIHFTSPSKDAYRNSVGEMRGRCSIFCCPENRASKRNRAQQNAVAAKRKRQMTDRESKKPSEWLG
jgi:hypothetical protein